MNVHSLESALAILVNSRVYFCKRAMETRDCRYTIAHKKGVVKIQNRWNVAKFYNLVTFYNRCNGILYSQATRFCVLYK